MPVKLFLERPHIYEIRFRSLNFNANQMLLSLRWSVVFILIQSLYGGVFLRVEFLQSYLVFRLRITSLPMTDPSATGRSLDEGEEGYFLELPRSLLELEWEISN